ncbi:MAG: hypothetical protein KJI72_00605 [Patescibacteria group bacterium]|nr:hypothetical protein [Patescibacteria group bacterium]
MALWQGIFRRASIEVIFLKILLALTILGEYFVIRGGDPNQFILGFRTNILFLAGVALFVIAVWRISYIKHRKQNRRDCMLDFF